MLVFVPDKNDTGKREALERALQLAGFDVETHLRQQLAALSSDEHGPRTPSVLDVMMPGYDGLDVTRRLRREGNRVPVLLLTARDAVGDRVDGLDAGAEQASCRSRSRSKSCSRASARSCAVGSGRIPQPVFGSRT